MKVPKTLSHQTKYLCVEGAKAAIFLYSFYEKHSVRSFCRYGSAVELKITVDYGGWFLYERQTEVITVISSSDLIPLLFCVRNHSSKK